MNFYAFHIGDYASATRHLSWDEDLAYRRLLDAYYVREAPLPLERRQVYRLACASTDDQRQAIDTVLDEFFVEAEDGWRNVRADEEIAKAKSKREKAAQSANVRWGNADAERSQCDGNATAQEEVCERTENGCDGNAPNPNPNPNKTPAFEYPGDFEQVWLAYPKRPGANKRAAYKAWNARLKDGVSPEDILNGVMRYAAYCDQQKVEPQFVKQPETFLGPNQHFRSEWADSRPPRKSRLPL